MLMTGNNVFEKSDKKVENSKNLVIKIIFIVVLVGFLFAVYQRADSKDIPVSAIDKQLRSKTNIEKMELCGTRDVAQFIGIQPESEDSYIYYKSREALGVEEILIIKSENADFLSDVVEAVEKRVDSQMKAYEGYGPEQVKMLDNAIIIKKGLYVFYSVGDDSEKYMEVFKDAV